MQATKNPIPSPYALIPRKGTFGSPTGSELWDIFPVTPLGRMLADGQGGFRMAPVNSVLDGFECLPASALAAGADPHVKQAGTATLVAATRAAKGGINIATQAGTAAKNDFVSIYSAPNNGTIVPITTASQPRWATRLSLNAIAGVIVFAGLNQTFSAGVVDPTTAAGDGVGFLFVPAPGASGTTLTNSTGYPTAVGNWVLFQKVNGTFYFLDSGIAVVSGTDYDLVIQFDNNLTPSWYINGALVGTAAQGNTASASVGTVIGDVISANAPTAAVDMDIRYLEVGRLIG